MSKVRFVQIAVAAVTEGGGVACLDSYGRLWIMREDETFKQIESPDEPEDV